MGDSIIHLTIGKANPDRANGINVIVHALASTLHEKGFAVEVWGITPTPDAPTPPRTYPLRLFRARRTRFALDPALRDALERLPASSIVHLHGGLLPEFHAVARCLHRRSIPWVLMPHGCYSPSALEHRPLLKRAYMRLFDRFVIENARWVQFVAETSAKGVRHLLDPRRTAVIPNGYEVAEEPPHQPPVPPFRFSFCGRLALKTKGLDLLIAAFERALATAPHLRLDLIGDGPDRARLERMIEEGVAEGRVTFHGSLFAAEKHGVLRETHCFVLTSRHEGFPMALLEAAALGLPLLVSEGTNFGDYVRRFECGAVAADLAPGPLAQSLLTVASASREQLLGMGANSQRLIREELSCDRIADRVVEQLYRPVWESRSECLAAP